MLKVFILNGDNQYRDMWLRNGYSVIEDIEEADIVQFTGGEDVTPHYYQEAKHPRSYCNEIRDAQEMDYFQWCREAGMPMVGICRGGQFLNVANGGSMWQHCNNHAIHGTHTLIDLPTGYSYEVSSTHHQMMNPADHGEILAVASEATWVECMEDKDTVVRYEQDRGEDVEVVWYEDTRSLCFQPHPEYFDKDHPCQEYFFELVSEFLED